MTAPLHVAAAAYRILREELLQRYPELAEDNETLLDTLEGMTTLHDQLAALLRSALDDEDMVEAIAIRQKKLSDRKVALHMRAERKRKIALHYMDDMGIKRIVADDMTVSRRVVPPSVTILNVEDIPDSYCRFKREPDKTAIKDAINHGIEVPGASLNNGGETISIKV